MSPCPLTSQREKLILRAVGTPSRNINGIRETTQTWRLALLTSPPVSKAIIWLSQRMCFSVGQTTKLQLNLRPSSTNFPIGKVVSSHDR